MKAALFFIPAVLVAMMIGVVFGWHTASAYSGVVFGFLIGRYVK